MGAVTDAIDGKINETLAPPWSVHTHLRPVGVEQVGGLSVNVSAGPVSWKIGGTPQFKWNMLIDDWVSGNFSNFNPANNFGVSLNMTQNNFFWSVGGSYSGGTSSGSASVPANWTVGFTIGGRF